MQDTRAIIYPVPGADPTARIIRRRRRGGQGGGGQGGEPTVPADVIRLNAVPLTLHGDYVTLREAA